MNRALVGLAALLAFSACSKPREVVVFHAASLRRVMADAAAAFQKAEPGVRIRLEPSGSQVALRKVTEQGLAADVVATADGALLEAALLPAHASWAMEFASGEIVLAHLQHSRFTDEVGERNWPEILSRPGVRLGRVDPDLAPLGYHTLFCWELAERYGGFGAAADGLAARLAAAARAERLAADETELLGMLESRAVDYAFLYRSTAEDHHLKVVRLSRELSLADPSLASTYGGIAVEVRAASGPDRRLLAGRPITYGITVPSRARNPADAERFVAFLAGPQGQALQRAAGFTPLVPPRCKQAGALPAALAAVLAPGKGP
ncbi:MAG TPA: extracellular solute-binding protein [Myxococcales bacterium]|jgi:molybdate/tungstate transport system substrate-binding protein